MATVAAQFITTSGDNIRPVEPGYSVPVKFFTSGIGGVIAQQRNPAYSTVGDQTQMRGWIFVIDPATLQPQVHRATDFPGAQ